jgi:hypothetical protein
MHAAKKPGVNDLLRIVREKVELVLGKGDAEFVDTHTVRVGEKDFYCHRY